jgi:hypothetical protein
MSDENTEFTMHVVDAGRRFFGIGRNAAYRAAKAGDIPCVKIGGRLFASVPAIELMLRNAGKAGTASAE